jgi:putative copper export protein
MAQPLLEFARSLAKTGAHDVAVDWLRNVPGLPPIVQTLHLLSIAVILGTTVLLSLRALGWAVPSQQPAEMARRLAPWTWGALPVLLLSGGMFVIARPQRYFTNPVFGLKIAFMLPALVLGALLYRAAKSDDGQESECRERRSAGAAVTGRTRLLAGLNLIAWTGVVLAGRWIAYSEYLFPPE